MKNLLYFTLFSLAHLHSGYSQGDSPERMIFDHLGVIEGLSQSWVLTMEQDSDGFMWMGTRDGLNRYDGRNFKVYRSSKKDSTSLCSSHITSLLIDAQGRMWVGTVEGLNVYLREKDRFERIPVNDLKGIHINDLAEGKDQVIWIAALEGLYQYDPKGDSGIELILQSDKEEKISSDRMKSVFQDGQDNLWVDVEGGLMKLEFNSQNNRIIQSYMQLPKPDAGAVRDIIEYPEGTLWIGTDRGGVFRFHLESKTFDHLSEGNGLISNYVKKIMPDPEKNELWIGTRHGLSIYELNVGTFRNVQQSIHDPRSLSDNSIHSIYKDKDGSYWLGTYSSGINIHSESFFKITTYEVKPGNRGLNYATVSAINEIKPGQYLIGTEGGGMNYHDSETGLYQYFVHNVNIQESLPLNNVKCIFKDRDGSFWVGTSGGGVCDFNPKQGTFRAYTHDEIGIRNDAWVYSITQDHEGILWFGIFETGLRWYDKKTGEHGLITSAASNSFFFSGIRKLMVDSKNRIWIGTDNGLSVYDQKLKTFRYFLEDENDPSTIGSNVVYTLYEDRNKTIWIGTLGGGLNKYDEASDSFLAYQIEDGLPGNNIFGILEDDNDHLWLSTNRGISKFNSTGEIFQNYTIQDGLLDMEYGYNSYFKSENGELFFGGRNGLVSFYPEDIKENRSVSPVVITDLKLFNQPVSAGDETGILQNQIGHTRKITLNHNQNVFTIGFSVLNYVKSTKNQFAYRLEGLEENWNHVETPSATYMNLKPGTYSFMAKGANNDGHWNTDPALLKITILPAPWKTNWAYMCYTLLFMVALIVLIRYQRIKATLEHDLKLKEFENNRQKELNHAKLKFFTDISHEIRTPLTLILSPIEDIINNYRSDPKLYKQFLSIKKNADRLLRLVNQLLDFRKRESGKVRLKAAEGNFIKFVKEISLAFQDQARKRNISYTFSTDTENLSLYYDRDEMEKVFFNLISNAFKYTPDSESIEISVHSGEKVRFEDNEPSDAVRIEIKDSGIGINLDDIENIFERYYEADHSGVNSLSTGIGLSLSKSIIKAHKGQIACVSHRGADGEKNTTLFTVYLRYGMDHLDPEDIMDNFKGSELIEEYYDLLVPLENSETIESFSDTQGGDISRTLLVVEDNDEIRSFLADHLSKYYRVEEASDGKMALEMACKIIPDLIISDVLMPEMNGIELCNELKNDERTSHIPVIILTARTSLIHKVEGIDSGADEYLIKPFNLELLKAKIRNLIESREQLRKKYSREITLQPENIVISNSDEKFLQRMTAILEEGISNPEFNVNHLIKEVGMSRTVLYRKIKAVTNMSIIDFIVNYRLNKAAILLKTSNNNISEIAYEVGFSDPKYFSRAFRKKFGLTPKKYGNGDLEEQSIAENEPSEREPTSAG